MKQEIENYIKTLKEDQRERETKVLDFKKQIQSYVDDPEGLVRVATILLQLKQEYQTVREFIYNIEREIKNAEALNQEN